MDIRAALEQLDPENDEQWTGDGLPKVDAVAALVGDENVKRADIKAADENFDREAARVLKVARATDPEAPEEVVAEPEAPQTFAQKVWAEMERQQAELTEIDQAMSKLRDRKRELEHSISYLSGKYEQVREDRPEDSVRQYIDSQKKLREDRAARIKAINESNLPDILKSVGPSALDAAMKKRKASPSSERREYPTSIKRD